MYQEYITEGFEIEIEISFFLTPACKSCYEYVNLLATKWGH